MILTYILLATILYLMFKLICKIEKWELRKNQSNFIVNNIFILSILIIIGVGIQLTIFQKYTEIILILFILGILQLIFIVEELHLLNYNCNVCVIKKGKKKNFVENILKDGDILIFKENELHRMISLLTNKNTRKWHLTRFLLSFFTFTKYNHTATLIKKWNGWYIVQSLTNGGVCETPLNLSWLEEQIIIGNISIYRQKKFDKLLFDQRLKETLGEKYNFKGLINIAWFNPNKRIICKLKHDKYFSSQLTSYLHNLNKEHRNIRPIDLIENINLQQVYK